MSGRYGFFACHMLFRKYICVLQFYTSAALIFMIVHPRSHDAFCRDKIKFVKSAYKYLLYLGYMFHVLNTRVPGIKLVICVLN